jgi:hypothetical protein
MPRLITSAATLLCAVALSSLARAEAPGRHPNYIHALADLRAARAHLERPASFGPRTAAWDERTAIGEIDAALEEIKRAAIWDGKPLSDHYPIDAALDWRGRTRQALELLRQAEHDVGLPEDNPAVRGMQARALGHIRQSIRFVEEGRRALRFDDEMAGAPPPQPYVAPPPPQPMPAQHPAYLHALSDLREARAHLERPRNYFAPRGANWDEHVAVTEIDAAIDEIKRAAIWDGKPLTDHPPVDAGLDWRGRIHRSLELLHQAERDISQEEDNPSVRGLQQRAREHVLSAIRLTEDGQRRMHFERM